MTKVVTAFSPDSDDLFMFWPLLNNKIDTRGLTFVADRADTETLNARAESGSADVIAVSMAHYARVSDKYLLLPHGASVGRGYGPVVVATSPTSIDDLCGKRIAIPGTRTTAYAVLRILVRAFSEVVVPISPYARVFDALRKSEVDAALLIHEGRLTYEREGMNLVMDIGQEWLKSTGLPLPLGGNAIRRGLGEETIRTVSDLCRESIAWSLAHRDEVMQALLSEETRDDVGLTKSMLDRYLSMYANEDTREMKDDVKLAVVDLAERMYKAKLLKTPPKVEFSA